MRGKSCPLRLTMHRDYARLLVGMVPGKYSAGRPVYRNDAGRFLMVKNEFTSFSVWDDADKRLHAGKGDEGERFIQSGSAPTCVTDLENEVGREGHGWQIRNGEGWIEDDTIRAVCSDSRHVIRLLQ
jgi:hypothetical protein